MMSMRPDIRLGILACGAMLTNLTLSTGMPTAWAKAGHMTRAASPGGLPMLWPGKSFGPVMPLALLRQ